MTRQPAPLGRRFLSLFYEAFPVAGLIWAAAFAYSATEEALHLVHVRPLFQAYLAAMMGIYFVVQWVRGGQTLAMKTWRLKIERVDGGGVTTARALVRYVAALAGTLALGITYLWAVLDRDRAFLHDRIAGTRVVRL